LDGYIDRELDPVRSLEVEQHLEQCSACTGTVKERQALTHALRDPSLYHSAPAHLRRRVRAAVFSSAERRSPWALWQVFAVAASVVLGMLITWAVMRVQPGLPSKDLLADAVVASHVRSLLATHLLDVKGPDRHVIKPWFTGKLDYAPPVLDLEAQGFTLEGGRLDYVDQRKVASIVYKQRQHIINLFIWPVTPSEPEATAFLQRQGYHIVHWVRSGLSFWAISDLNEQELRDFAHLIREQAD
jgi:anti-sigma factor RsiW